MKHDIPRFHGEELAPGHPKFDEIANLVNEVHNLVSPLISDDLSDQRIIDVSLATLLWAGGNFGLLKSDGRIDISPDFIAAMVENLKNGIDMGERRARYIMKHGATDEIYENYLVEEEEEE